MRKETRRLQQLASRQAKAVKADLGRKEAETDERLRIKGGLQPLHMEAPPEMSGTFFPAVLNSIEPSDVGDGVQMHFSVNLNQLLGTRPLLSGFDPWDIEGSQFPMNSPEFAARAIAQSLTHNRASIEADGMDLLNAVGVLLRSGLSAPKWLVDAWFARWTRMERFEVGSLDECFGKDTLTERTRKAEHRLRELIVRVHQAIVNEVRDHDRPIDDELFETVAERFGIGKTLCKEAYWAAVNEHDKQSAADLRKLRRQAGSNPKR